MTVPLGLRSEPNEPFGYTYAAVLVRQRHGARPQEHLLDTLRRIWFSGWVAPAEQEWAVIVPKTGKKAVAGWRHGVVGVGEALAQALAATTVAVRVLEDRQLVLVVWQSGQEVARYVSDPSREPGAAEDVLPDPVGAEGADAIAEACGRPDVGEELGELLAEPLDPEQDIESERLDNVLRLLGLPSWLVNCWRLPRDMATGPATRDLLRLSAGRKGPLGWVAGPVANLGRRWRLPPPVLVDPPRGGGDMEDPAMWL